MPEAPAGFMLGALLHICITHSEISCAQCLHYRRIYRHRCRLARQYASRGAVVGLVARNRDKLEALADALPGGRDRNIVLPCDVTVREEVLRRLKSLSDFPVALL